jgi:tRNA(Arg) A34 adenosine deaminase TadA
VTDRTADTEALMQEVREEARRLRESGRLGGLEHELDALFESLAPQAGTGDFGSVLEELDRTSFIDPRAPVASDVPAGAAIKKTIRRLTGWQFEPLTRQINAFDHAVSSALRRVDERLALLEARLPAGEGEAFDLPPPVSRTDWFEVVVDALSGVSGRVLVVAVDARRWVERLRERQVDAYGVDPSGHGGADIRTEELLAHLATVAGGALGAAVIVGWADRLDVGGAMELADRLAAAVREGGRVALTSVDPRTWAGTVEPIVADLSPGRPLHPDTWTVVLAARGLRVARVEWRGDDSGTGEYALMADRAD